MEKTEKQERYQFEDFEQYTSLYNTIPSGSGNSLVLLRRICDVVQSKYFKRNPSILIIGDNAELYAQAFINSCCSSDVRKAEGKYLLYHNEMREVFDNSTQDSIHLISNPGMLGSFNEPVLYNFLKNRSHTFTVYKHDGHNEYELVQVKGTIIIIVDDIKSIPYSILENVDFKIEIDPYTHDQMLLLVHQRLKFAGIDYQNNEEVLQAIVKYGCGHLSKILDLLKVCILLVQTENQNILNLKIVLKAAKLLSESKNKS